MKRQSDTGEGSARIRLIVILRHSFNRQANHKLLAGIHGDFKRHSLETADRMEYALRAGIRDGDISVRFQLDGIAAALERNVSAIDRILLICREDNRQAVRRALSIGDSPDFNGIPAEPIGNGIRIFALLV